MKARRLRVLFYVACLLPVDLTVGASLLGAQVIGFFLSAFHRSRYSSFTSCEPPQTTSVTIQILTWDGRPLLEEFLPSVVEAAGNHEVMVVDNGSRDDSVEFLKALLGLARAMGCDQVHYLPAGSQGERRDDPSRQW